MVLPILHKFLVTWQRFLFLFQLELPHDLWIMLDGMVSALDFGCAESGIIEVTLALSVCRLRQNTWYKY